ncbi:MAG: HAMP domain-containing histidine kinase [Holophagales bacterium]|nr:HAMP domain-containing histidine kinase [Holophagales bacterium]
MKVPRFPSWAIVVLSVLFGAALLGTATLASMSLRQRDAAVREGILMRAGHSLENLLRAANPDEAGPVLETFLVEHADAVAGVAVVGPAGVVASAGADTTGAFEMSAALGREWRPLALGAGGEIPPGSGQGPGTGGGYMGGRGPGGRGPSPVRLRLRATPALGKDSALARLVLAGGAVAALALVGLSLVAARGTAERQRRQAAEAENRRLATVARAGAGLAHRLRNPLAVIKGTAQLLEARVPEAERERVERIVSASGRMETILSRLLDFARPPEPQPVSFDLAALARDVATRSGGAAVRAEGSVAVLADREHVETILEELLANARAFDTDGAIEVTVRARGTHVVLDVADRGPGLDLDPASAFEPYVTSRPDGTGLGLAIVKALAGANGGWAVLVARPGGGCVASLTLPASEA